VNLGLNVGRVEELVGKLHNSGSVAGIFVGFGRLVGLFPVVEILDRGVSLDAETFTKLFLLSGIDLGDLDLSLQRGSSLIPLGFEVLAVTAPRCVELNEPDILRVHDSSIEVRISKNDNILISRCLLLLLLRSAGFLVTSLSASLDLLHELVKGEFDNRALFSGSFVILGLLLVGAEPLERGEALNIVGGTDALVLGHIDGTDVDCALQLLSSLLPLRSQTLAVATPRRIKLNQPHLVRV